MADLSRRAPVEATKGGDYLHDRSRIPAGQGLSRLGWARQNWGYVVGVVLAMGGAAMAVQLRGAAWESHRDWVVPAGMLAGAVGGLCLALLLQRGRGMTAAGAGGCLFLAAVFGLMNIWRGYITEGSDGARDALTIIAAILFGLGIAWAVLGLIVVEVEDPIRPPEPEL